MMNEGEMSQAIYSAMQEGKPLRTYVKTILGKVAITVLNPFSGKPEGVILYGNPNDPDIFEKYSVQVWSPKEDEFFKRMNASHFRSGNLRALEDTELPKPVKRSVNEITDDEIVAVLNKPFLALKNKLDKFSSVAPVYRVLKRAEDMEKSEKILDAIRARLAELELESIPQPAED
jgi:hypothetical protein